MRRSTATVACCCLALLACRNIEVDSPPSIQGFPTRPSPEEVPAVLAWQRQAEANRSEIHRRYGLERAFYRNPELETPSLGLALSGGGLRSASFAIGVMHALHDLRLLDRLDCISAVSGGSYAMSWYLLQHYYERRNDCEFRTELFDPQGRFQGYLQDHVRLLTSVQSSAAYYVAATRGALLNVLFIPLNLLCNGLFPGHVNTVPMRLQYEHSIERAFHARPATAAEATNRSAGIPMLLDRGVDTVTEFGDLGQFCRAWRLPFFIVNTTNGIGDDYHHHNSQLRNLVFEMTPTGFGSDAYGYVRQHLGRAHDDPGIEFPVSFNRSIAISGAAADSNQQPMPATRVISSAANFNLGYYIPNYRRESSWLERLIPLPFHVWFGNSQWDVEGTDIYLSDGGHSDNLGAFSLIRRGCRNVIVVDAEHDPEFEFPAYRRLKAAVRQELGMELSVPGIDEHLRRRGLFVNTFEYRGGSATAVDPDHDPAFSPGNAVLGGSVTYLPLPLDEKRVEAVRIRLFYVKLSMEPHGAFAKEDPLPTSVVDYARTHENFPQQTTADQDYSPSQFRAYRDLGRHVGRKLRAYFPACRGTESRPR